jgi:23S rRNA pseudouridine955/2504/2580 synthase
VSDPAPARTGVETRAVAPADADLRLDRWFKRHYPQLGFGHLARLLRTGQVRVDGKRAKPGQRLAAGQQIRVPPLDAAAAASTAPARRAPAAVADADARALQAAVIYQDDDIIAINKPSGLAVQGGSGTRRHVDGMLDALRFDAAERPRLVHRLDKDTSGVLVLARHAAMAARLASLFRGRDVAKTYWALVAGVPEDMRGEISLALAKRPGAGGEKMVADAEGLPATTVYEVAEAIGNRMAWLVLRPRTGRTHQLRVHCEALGTPIVGDGKYGGSAAFIDGVANRLHLHARRIAFRHPENGRPVAIEAPLTGHMLETWRFLGLDPDAEPSTS